MVGAVARIEQPACQMDTMLVLEGPQGILKSSALRVLAGHWFADSGLAIGEKDSYQSLRRVWIYEIPEFASIKAARDIERVKAFLTSRCDHYRPSYGRRAIDVPRQCVFAGSTNESEYLLDKTGARRFWPFKCGRIDLVSLERDRDQLWAEAFTRYQSKERWWVDSLELRDVCEAEQADRTPVDPWVPIVQRWLGEGYVLVPDGAGGYDRVNPANGLTTTDLLKGAISMHNERIDRAAETRAGQVLRHLGWEARQIRTGSERVRRYFAPAQPVTTDTAESSDNQ
jgi:predicted P-loop ATPase